MGTPLSGHTHTCSPVLSPTSNRSCHCLVPPFYSSTHRCSAPSNRIPPFCPAAEVIPTCVAPPPTQKSGKRAQRLRMLVAQTDRRRGHYLELLRLVKGGVGRAHLRQASLPRRGLQEWGLRWGLGSHGAPEASLASRTCWIWRGLACPLGCLLDLQSVRDRRDRSLSLGAPG